MGTRTREMAEKEGLQPERQARVVSLFRAFDYDSSGAIDSDEFLCIGKAFRGDLWDETKNKAALARVDKDKNGSIDAQEFVTFFALQGMRARPDDKFNNLMDRYMAAAIAGRESLPEFRAGADGMGQS